MYHEIGAIYHILLKSEEGKWTTNPFQDHLVLKVGGSFLIPNFAAAASAMLEAKRTELMSCQSALEMWGRPGGFAQSPAHKPKLPKAVGHYIME